MNYDIVSFFKFSFLWGYTLGLLCKWNAGALNILSEFLNLQQKKKFSPLCTGFVQFY